VASARQDVLSRLSTWLQAHCPYGSSELSKAFGVPTRNSKASGSLQGFVLMYGEGALPGFCLAFSHLYVGLDLCPYRLQTLLARRVTIYPS